MDDLGVILALSFAMLVGCYLAGCVPLAFSFSEEKLKLLTILGAGLLVGTALAVIIPEGIAAIYKEHDGHHHHHDESPVYNEIKSVKIRSIKEEKDKNIRPLPASHSEGGEHHHGEKHLDSHKLVGISLVSGFVIMLLIDQLGGGHSHGGDPEAPPAAHSRNKVTATLGLCVHAAADGIALGAASSVSQTGLTIIVFIAIMLHKAPAAFGLVSFLLHDGLDRARIRKHLLAFSTAAPLGAILTFFVLNNQSKETLLEYNATGIAMLFSAGTFLYVSTVHILPEVSNKSSTVTRSDGAVIIREHKGFNKIELLTIVLGSLIPVGISFGHSHEH